MPRKARIDAPGALHHIICRGIERRKIFNDDVDRDNIFETSWKYVSRDVNAMLQLGVDTESFSPFIENRQRGDFHSYATPVDRLCRQL